MNKTLYMHICNLRNYGKKESRISILSIYLKKKSLKFHFYSYCNHELLNLEDLASWGGGGTLYVGRVGFHQNAIIFYNLLAHGTVCQKLSIFQSFIRKKLFLFHELLRTLIKMLFTFQ